jgi:predicted metal-dependent phosphotriesterase family hydrolase
MGLEGDYLCSERTLVPRLHDVGVAEEQIDEMFLRNPRRSFAT